VVGPQVGTVAPRGPMADLVASVGVNRLRVGGCREFAGALGETRPTIEGSKRKTPLLQHSNTPLGGQSINGSKTNDNLDESN